LRSAAGSSMGITSCAPEMCRFTGIQKLGFKRSKHAVSFDELVPVKFMALQLMDSFKNVKS